MELDILLILELWKFVRMYVAALAGFKSLRIKNSKGTLTKSW